MKTITINWKDIKSDVHAYCYGMTKRLEDNLRNRIAKSLERQIDLMIRIESDRLGVVYEEEVRADVSHSGPTVDLAEVDYSRIEARLLAHYLVPERGSDVVRYRVPSSPSGRISRSERSMHALSWIGTPPCEGSTV